MPNIFGKIPGMSLRERWGSIAAVEELLLKELKQFIYRLFINCAYKMRTCTVIRFDGLPHVLVTSHNFLELPAEGENLKE